MELLFIEELELKARGADKVKLQRRKVPEK
jgi:hypothetical protein